MALDILYAKVAQLVEQVNTYFYPYWKIRRLQIQTRKKFGIDNPRVVGSSPTLGTDASPLMMQPLTRILGVSTTTGKTMSVLDNQR